MIEPTSQNVVDFWQFMHSAFGTSTIDKEDAIEMQLVARLLSVLGIVEKDKFLNSFTTTIGKQIYTPFEIGIPSDRHSLWHQMVICVHEHQHVFQSKAFDYEINYVSSKTERTKYEIEAYRCNLELCFWRYGQIENADLMAELLSNYGVDNDDIAVARQSFKLMNRSIKQGIISSESTMKALEWLNANCSHIRNV